MNAWNSKKNVTRFFLPTCLTALALLAQSASAASLLWTNTPDGTSTWSVSSADTNWNGSDFTNGDDVTFSGAGLGPIDIPSNVTQTGMVVNHAAGTYTFTGTGGIQGAGALNKSGAGILEFQNGTQTTGNNTFSGINFGGGEIVFSNLSTINQPVSHLGTGTINVTANSILTFTRPDTNGANISNPMTIGNGLTMTFRRAGSQPSPNYSGKISGNADLVFDKPTGPGGNGWTISNATNDFTGNISINGAAAAATFSNEGSMGGATTITIQPAGGAFSTGAGVTGVGRTLVIAGTSGSFNNNGGMWQGLVTGGALNISNAGFNNAANSMSGITMSGVALGQLRIGVAGSIGTGAVTMDSNDFNTIVFTDASGGTYNNTLNLSSGLRTLTVNQASAVINYTGAINATGNDSMTTFVSPPPQIRAIIKNGAGTFITNNWNVTNQLSVNAGKFLLNDTTPTSNLSNIIVANGATFGGNGNLVFGAGKSLTVNGTLQPGSNGAGTLTLNGPLNLTSTTLLDYQLGTSGNDLIQLTGINGNLVLDGSLQVTPNGSFGEEGSSYTLFTYTGTLTDNGLELIGMPNGVLVFSPGEISLFFPIPIPEPATAWLIGLPVLVFARKLRKNRK